MIFIVDSFTMGTARGLQKCSIRQMQERAIRNSFIFFNVVPLFQFRTKIMHSFRNLRQ